jgi:hypothetical protein
VDNTIPVSGRPEGRVLASRVSARTDLEEELWVVASGRNTHSTVRNAYYVQGYS